jgi:dipeptidyl aminopeptidase/acylaminoacyl peptidase
LRRYPFLDSKRVGVMGSNYGGFLAGSLLAHRQERLLKCGILLAPIVDWRLTGTSSRDLWTSIVDWRLTSTSCRVLWTYIVNWRLTGTSCKVR